MYNYRIFAPAKTDGRKKFLLSIIPAVKIKSIMGVK